MMKNNDIVAYGSSLYRVLNVADGTVFVMDCFNPKMPCWISVAEADCKYVTEQELYERTGKVNTALDDLDAVRRRVALNRYTIIAGVLTFLTDVNLRGEIIKRLANEHNLSAQTIRNYLYEYLVYQNTAVLAPKTKGQEKKLTPDQKNIRWALNKFFYTKHNNSLNTAYTLMLKYKYCDENGVLLPEFPTFNQFRYFYRQHRNMQTFYISRDGKKHYERNNRPLLGDGVQAFAPNIGVGLLDATICDLYLVDDGGNLVGRPILTACVDAYSSMCCGYNLSWEGGNYSLRGLMLNIITDKVEHCKKFGISINKADWNCDKLLGTFVSDRGSEYISENFEQIAELGVSLLNLPAFRPDLKGKVEKFFDLVQNSYKKHLKGKGVIQPDFGERGGTDYRKEGCLTLKEFETILLHCIIFYNTKLVLKNFPFTEDMLKAQVKPFANCIWNHQLDSLGSNLIPVTAENLNCNAFRSLETLHCKNSVLKNIEFVAEDHRTELDAIVVTEKAIFIVEVKNPGKDIYIDERGNYCRVSDTLIFDKNIGEKMNEKDYLLREALKDCGVENINIQNIVVFTNSAMHVENRFPYINTCYLSDMPHIIGGYNGDRIYNDADINNIVNAIETNKCHESYPMPIDMQEFKNDFATLMATLEKASETKEEPVEDEAIQTVAETVEAEEQTKGYHTAVAWFKKHKIASHLVASVAVVALASIAVVSATTKR